MPEKVGMGELMLENLLMGELWSWARFFFCQTLTIPRVLDYLCTIFYKWNYNACFHFELNAPNFLIFSPFCIVSVVHFCLQFRLEHCLLSP